MHLKHLLLRALPLDRVGPVVRARAQRAALEGDPERMRSIARQVVGDLLRRGELVAMSAGHDGGPRRPLYLVRGTSRLVDLGYLAAEGQAKADVVTSPAASTLRTEIPTSEVPSSEVRAATLVEAAEETEPTLDLSSVAALLGAMEEAQDLELGDPLSNVPQVVLGGILALLERQLPAVQLVLLLDRVDPSRPRDRRVVAREANAGMPFWLHHRLPGSLAVLCDPVELPDAVSQVFGTSHATDVAIVAVPLIEPAELGPDAYAEPRETGILFAATRNEELAPHLLPLAQQLTGFVTRRWRQQWTVNRRIHADSLTGVRNRAYFDIQFTIELERARRGGFPLTLVLGDLDCFKDVNDTHGHHYGDLMLQEVARVLQAALRRIDHICRIGGEEFALVLPHTTVAEASEVMGRLLARPFSVTLPAARGGGQLSVTMSYGVVTYPEAGADAFELYRKADAMLYLSKDRGRNRCHFWREGENPLPLAAAAAGD
jgi:diguanylate cyclase (GGDEF)-like protein